MDVLCGSASNTTIDWGADCTVDVINIISSSISTLIFIICIIYIKYRKERRKTSNTLFRCHSPRSVFVLFLSLSHLAELCDALLSVSLFNGSVSHIWYTVTTPSVSLCSVIGYVALVRCAEIRSSPGWLMVSALVHTCCVASRCLRVYSLWDFIALGVARPLFAASSAGLLALLVVVDLFTRYLEFIFRFRSYTPDSSNNRGHSLDGDNSAYRYSSATLISKATFWWFTPLLWKGYCAPLEVEDLGSLPATESANGQFEAFIKIYNHEKVLAAEHALPPSLWRCYFRSCWRNFLLGGLYKLLGDCVGLVGPLGIAVIIKYVAQQQEMFTYQANVVYPTVNQLFTNGYVMGLIVLLSSVSQGTLSQISTHLVNVEGIRIKTAVQALIYDKSLRLSSRSFYDNKCSQDNSLKQSNQNVKDEITVGSDIGTITNLMSEDAFNVMSFFWIGHYVWAIPLKIAILMYLLYLQLGLSAVIGALFCIFTMTPLQCVIGKLMSTNSKLIFDRSDERLRKINEVLQGIKLIKLNASESFYENKISESRESELKYLDKDSLYWALMTFLTHVSSVLVTLVTFGVFFLLEEDGDIFSPGRVFTALALFNQLTVPLFIFPITVPIILSALVSTTRIEHFLSLPETVLVLPSLNKYSSTGQKHSILEYNVKIVHERRKNSVYVLGNIEEDEEDSEVIQKDLKCLNDQISNESSEEDIDDAVVAKHTVIKRSHSDVEYPSSHINNDATDKNGEIHVLKMEKCLFCWKTAVKKYEDSFFVESLKIPQGKLTIIFGQVGSGKTSLLSAILGEMNLEKGKLTWTKDVAIAYVSQKPWLLNGSVRDNILFGAKLRQRRYDRVLMACALQPDIELLPKGDQTEIGERGLNISGGQRQRIAVARAIYSTANVVICDDPLSALDYHVGQEVFENGIQRLLIRQKRTAILVTHRLQLLPSADHIISVENRSLRAAGSLSEIEKVAPDLTKEWRNILSREALDVRRNDSGKTARERWALIKMVNKLGLQLSRPKFDTETIEMVPPEFIPLRRRPSTLYGSRYFTHDLPLPTDECDDMFIEHSHSRSSFRRRSRMSSRSSGNSGSITRIHRVAVRAISLQNSKGSDRNNMVPIVRQYSSPSMKHVDCSRSRENSLLRHIFSHGSKPSVSAQENINQIEERNLLRRLVSSPSVKSRSASEQYHVPVMRLISSTSAVSEDMNDEEELSGTDVNFSSETEEERAYGSIPCRTYLLYIKSCGFGSAILYLTSAISWQSLRVYTDVWLSDWTNKTADINGELGNHKQEMFHYFKVYCILSAVCIVFSLFSSAAGQVAGMRARRVLHKTLLEGILGKPIHFFESTPVGRLITRFSSDTAVIDKKIATSIQRLLQFLFLCFCAVLVNIAITPWFICVAIPICVVYHVVQRFYRCSSRELQRLDNITRAPVFSHFSETLNGLTTIRAFGQQRQFMDTLLHRLDVNTNAFLIMNTSNRWLGIALDYLGGVIVFTAILTSLISAWILPGVITPALVGLAVNYTLLVPIYLNWVVKFLADMEMYMGAVEWVQQYADIPAEDYQAKGMSVPRAWPDKGMIEFKKVTLCYPGKAPVITDFTLTIPAGQKVGICGRTGSGKTSLVMALFQMLKITNGQIIIDDVDISKISLQTLRSRLSIIPQDVILFGGSIRENLDPKGQYSDQQLWRSLEVVQLKEIIEHQNGGLNGEVKDGGENLSAGQRQLFCLARAVLQEATCLVMDEATSSVDVSTERALITAVAREFRSKTVITIAHRLSTILEYDRILVLENGQLVEDGHPHDLRSKAMGIFSSMLRASAE